MLKLQFFTIFASKNFTLKNCYSYLTQFTRLFAGHGYKMKKEKTKLPKLTKSNVNIVGFSCSSSCCDIRIWEQRTLVVRSVLRGLRKAVILSVEVVDKKKMMYFTEQQLATRQQLPYNKTFEWYDGFPVLDNKTNTFGYVEREPLDPWVRGEGESFSCLERIRWGFPFCCKLYNCEIFCRSLRKLVHSL